MKTLRVFFIATALFLFTNEIMAQGGYLNLKAGYALPVTRSAMGNNSSGENIYATAGNGVPLALGFGYAIEEHWGLEMEASFLVGTKYTIDEPAASNKTELYGQQFRLSPAVFVTTGSSGFDFYSKFGLVIPVYSSTTMESSVTAAGSTTKTEVTYKGFPTIGLKGAFGFTYDISDALSFFSEAEFHSLNVKTEEEEMAGSTVSYEREKAPVMPYSSIGLNVGLRIKFE